MNKGAIIAGIVGITAVGIGAYALTRGNSNTQQSVSDTAFSGFNTGGGGARTEPSTADTVSRVLKDILSTSNQNDGFSMIKPEMQSMNNPSDEVADVKQRIDSVVGYDPELSNLYLSGVMKDQNTSQKTTAVEYNQGNSFSPAPKQADMSTYNQGKTGGNTENTPKQSSEKKDSGEKSSSNNGMKVEGVLAPIGKLTGWW